MAIEHLSLAAGKTIHFLTLLQKQLPGDPAIEPTQLLQAGPVQVRAKGYRSVHIPQAGHWFLCERIIDILLVAGPQAAQLAVQFLPNIGLHRQFQAADFCDIPFYNLDPQTI